MPTRRPTERGLWLLSLIWRVLAAVAAFGGSALAYNHDSDQSPYQRVAVGVRGAPDEAARAQQPFDDAVARSYDTFANFCLS
ncbi:MAG: hypothetical protein ACRDGU_02305 [Actinomycetota bacterium]